MLGLHPNFTDLSFRKVSERLYQLFKKKPYFHVEMDLKVQKSLEIRSRRRKILEYIVDETLLNVCS